MKFVIYFILLMLASALTGAVFSIFMPGTVGTLLSVVLGGAYGFIFCELLENS